MRKHHFSFTVIAVIVLISLSASFIVAEVTINNKGFAKKPTVVEFPGGPPPSPPAGIDLGKHDAIAVAWVAVSGGAFKGYMKDGCFNISSMDPVNVEGNTTIYQPDNADQKLKDHEEGHDDLNRFEYDRNAVKKLTAIMDGFDKMKFCDADPQKALKAAEAERDKRFRAAEQAIINQMNVLGKVYDSNEYTAHNHNDMDPGDAVEDIKKHVKELEAKKDTPASGAVGRAVPAPKFPVNPLFQCSDPVAFIRFRNNWKGAIMWEPPEGMQVNPLPSDNLFGRLLIIIDKLLPLGKKDKEKDPKDDFSDAMVVFADVADSNEVYMEAGIFQITLAESDRPEYAYMLHGVLDVLPKTINNAVGSDWLGVMETAALNGQTCGFWVYFDEPLMDEDGQFIDDNAMVPAEMIFAPVEAEPGTVSNNFDEYPDTAALMAEWMPASAAVELTDDTLQGPGAMLVNYDTLGAPMAEVSHVFPIPQDWLAAGKTHLELWMNTDPNAPDVLGNLTVSITAGAMYPIKLVDGPFDVHVEMGDDGYAAVSIPLEILYSQGAALHDVSAISLTIEEDPLDGGAVSSFLVDEIRLADAPLEPIPEADLDDDFKVTITDFAIFAEQWLEGV